MLQHLMICCNIWINATSFDATLHHAIAFLNDSIFLEDTIVWIDMILMNFFAKTKNFCSMAVDLSNMTDDPRVNENGPLYWLPCQHQGN